MFIYIRYSDRARGSVDTLETLDTSWSLVGPQVRVSLARIPEATAVIKSDSLPGSSQSTLDTRPTGFRVVQYAISEVQGVVWCFLQPARPNGFRVIFFAVGIAQGFRGVPFNQYGPGGDVVF